MGERICVLKDGVIQQVDTPVALYQRPANAFVAGFIGSPEMNLLAGELVALDDGPGVRLGQQVLARSPSACAPSTWAPWAARMPCRCSAR